TNIPNAHTTGLKEHLGMSVQSLRSRFCNARSEIPFAIDVASQDKRQQVAYVSRDKLKAGSDICEVLFQVVQLETNRVSPGAFDAIDQTRDVAIRNSSR